jgi:hypothetical protein
MINGNRAGEITKVLFPSREILCHRDRGWKMHIIIRIISIFIGLFIIINGIWIVVSLPVGDELLGCFIVAVGIIVPLLVQYVAQIDDKRET